jgi:hypothetical protein
MTSSSCFPTTRQTVSRPNFGALEVESQTYLSTSPTT